MLLMSKINICYSCALAGLYALVCNNNVRTYLNIKFLCGKFSHKKSIEEQTYKINKFVKDTENETTKRQTK